MKVDTMEIFYLILLAICFGSMAIYTYVKYRKGKVEMLQRKKDEIWRKEKLRKEAPDIYEEIYKKEKEEKIE